MCNPQHYSPYFIIVYVFSLFQHAKAFPVLEVRYIHPVLIHVGPVVTNNSPRLHAIQRSASQGALVQMANLWMTMVNVSTLVYVPAGMPMTLQIP